MHSIDWSEIFAFTLSPWELIIRGTLIYWFLFLIFRFVVRRDMGSIALSDVLVLVIIADASQNAMAGEYKSVADGLVLISTLVGWDFFLDWASFRFPKMERWIQPPPLLLISRGKILHRNLRREFLTVAELMSKLRECEVEDVKQVKKAYMESNGAVTVLKSPDHKKD